MKWDFLSVFNAIENPLGGEEKIEFYHKVLLHNFYKKYSISDEVVA